jgi:hypothetical protein
VVSAWVAPGKTTFTVDGPLPSDGHGRWLSILAALLAVGGIVAWSLRRFRVRILRRVALARRKFPSASKVAAIGVPLVLAAMLVRGCLSGGPVPALELGHGLRGTADVAARANGGDWQTCDYHRVQGTYICDGLVVAYDGMSALLNDATPSWAFNTPGILASADIPGVEIRLRFHEHLAGTYWYASSGDGTLSVSDEADRGLDPSIVSYADQGVRTIEVRSHVPMAWWKFTFVREDTIIPPRPFLVEPPETAPPAIQAIH